MEKKKECTKCHKFLPFSAFGQNISRNDGLQQVCRACRRAAYRQAHGGLERALAKFTTEELLSEIKRREQEEQGGRKAERHLQKPKTT